MSLFTAAASLFTQSPYLAEARISHTVQYFIPTQNLSL